LRSLQGRTIDEIVRDAAVEAQSHGRVELISRSLSGRRLDHDPVPGSWLSLAKIESAIRPARKLYVRTIGRVTAYEMLIALVRLFPFGTLRAERAGARMTGQPRIGYTISRYPALSETFIRREVLAARSAGLDLEVVAIGPSNPPMAADPDSPGGPVHYYGPLDAGKGGAALRTFFLRRPLRVLRLWLFITGRRDFRYRTLWRDRDLLSQSAQLAAALQELGVTHVHAPWATRHAINALVASRLIGATFSVQARASEVNRRLERDCVFDRVAGASFIIANSEFIARSLRTIADGRRLPPIHVNYNGLDLHRFVPPHRTKERAPRIRIVSIGRLIEAKGFRYLLAACDVLRARGHDFTCEIIGGSDPDDPTTWIELRRMLDALGLGDVVTFSGPMTFSRVLSALESADIFALPCVEGRDGTQDVTPNALIEAMAMRLPVVSTVSGAIPEIVDDGENGLLVQPGDSDALAASIERLILDADLRQRLGDAARSKVERVFDSRFSAERLSGLFSSAPRASVSRA
jgi:glycosyltransferase involved in cell wall biosynthesis